MDVLFLKILDMSKIASFVILFVMLVRFALKRAPKIYSYLLWAVVLFRLLCPVSIESPVSFVPEMETVKDSYTQVKQDNSSVGKEEDIVGVENIYPVRDTLIMQGWVPATQDEVLTTQNGTQVSSTMQDEILWLEVFIGVGSYIWLAGVIFMVGRSLYSYYKLRQKLVGNIHLRENIYICDYIDSPFVMGIVKPKIYLPSFLKETEQEYIILHEQQHMRRKDHWIKMAAYAAICVHWFNPLVWLAFVLANKDMEMSCDEAVVGQTECDIRAEYSASLLNLATGRQVFSGVPLAFGEGDTKGRIKNMARWKKPSLWIGIVSVMVVAIVGIVLAVNPEKSQKDVLATNHDENNSANKKDVEWMVGRKSSMIEGENGWYYVFNYSYPKEGAATNGLKIYDFYGVNLKYRYLDDYMVTVRDVVNGELVEKTTPQPIQTLEQAKSVAMQNDLEEIASILKADGGKVTPEELLSLTVDDLTFEAFDEEIFIGLMQEALKGKPHKEGEYKDLPSYGLFEEKKYLDNYKFQIGFICVQGCIDAVAIDVLYRSGEGSELDDYKQLSDLVATGRATEAQIELYDRIKKIEEGIIKYNNLSYDTGGSVEIAGVYMPRLNILQESIERNDYTAYD